MGLDIGGDGFMGLAFETTSGTYVAPTKYFPILSENLQWKPNNQFRRPIRQSVDQIGMVPGNVDVSGTVTMECLDDVIVYWLYTMRMTIVKTGTGPYTYTCTPIGGAQGLRTLSLTVVRAGTVFGYVGCCCGKLTLTVRNDVLEAEFEVVGTNETNQSLPTATWGTTTPFGPGQWNIQIPTATQVFDLDTFSYSIDEKAAAQYRLKNTGPNQGRGAQFVSMGERTIQLTASRDFTSRSEYNIFQNNTTQAITITATQGANDTVSFIIPVAIISSYTTQLQSQGDLIRANITYETVIDGTGKASQLVITTMENIT